MSGERSAEDGFVDADAHPVSEGLWVGGDLAADDDALATRQLDELVAAGVSQIVDLRLEWDDRERVAQAYPDVDYVWLGVDDAGQRMPDQWFEAGTDAVVPHLEAGGASLVHCHMGINRGPSMAYAVLLRLGWDPVDALARIVERREIALADYAEDALDWWLRRQGIDAERRTAEQERLRAWRDEHGPTLEDVVRITRGA